MLNHLLVGVFYKYVFNIYLNISMYTIVYFLFSDNVGFNFKFNYFLEDINQNDL